MQPTLLILTNFPAALEVQKCKQFYESKGYLVDVKSPLEVNLHIEEVYSELIVDLDTIEKDTEQFKEHLADLATSIYIVCFTSLARLIYYNDFHCFTSFDNLIQREFFKPF